MKTLQPFKAGDLIRQYHTAARTGFTEATVVRAHSNGALDVITLDGRRYGWSAGFCELSPEKNSPQPIR